MSDVFISYSYQEREKAEQLASALENRGLSPWLAHKNLSGSKDFRYEILKKLDSCKALVLLVEPTRAPSDRLQLEYMAALESVWKDQDKLLIPILTGKGDVPAFLRPFSVWRIPDRKKDWSAFSERLADTIKESRKPNSSVHVSGDERRRWKLILDEVESSAHRIQGEEIIEGAKRHLAVTDPSNRKAMDLLSAQHRTLAQGERRTRRSRRASSHKQTVP